MALVFAARVIRESPNTSDRERIRFAIRCALSREPTVNESQILADLLRHERKLINSNPSLAKKRTIGHDHSDAERTIGDRSELAVWFAVANTLLNLDEVICQ